MLNYIKGLFCSLTKTKFCYNLQIINTTFFTTWL